ncbi:hypothetical protein [Actinoplanes couchii]|uniref:Polyketide cyclase/dehydrase n=1 Tax=Actinoplanes couchii TaxID=403638 RepID=A0ABQ3XNS5_9ACTN|nr:hypothetical protein [Actinoplanes couchii]MDR6319697.1 hypothetical protein [Actinoplanes couchii]GID60082.1 hypothetical protein Aco03nite_084860 [Actinoplanes couchii]
MKSEVLRHSFTVPASPGVVVSHLLEPQSYVGLNGFVVAVRDIREEDGFTAYTAIERLPVLGFHFDGRLRVRVRGERDGTRFVMEVGTRGGVGVRIVTDVSPAPEGTLAEDTITLTAAAPVRWYARKQARAGQLQRAETLAARFS